MKKIVIGIFVLCVHALYANEPMFSYDTEWHYRITDCFSDTTTQYTATVHDSLFNGKVYQEIYGGLLRTEGAKVWCLIDSLGMKVEQLLYDFDMQVGDSIRTLYFPEYDPYEPPHYAKVTHTETIVLSDGRSARRIYYDSRSDDIEHVGNVNGILGATIQLSPPCGGNSDFVCSTREDYILYEITPYECEKLITAIENTFSGTPSTTKFLRDGQLFIRRGDKTYTIHGTEIK